MPDASTVRRSHVTLLKYSRLPAALLEMNGNVAIRLNEVVGVNLGIGGYLQNIAKDPFIGLSNCLQVVGICFSYFWKVECWNPSS